jgi:hypothetical protein
VTPFTSTPLDTLLQTMAAGTTLGAVVGQTVPVFIQAVRDRRAAKADTDHLEGAR